MKVAGFTIVRNALKYDYPVLESIASVLPICDEVLVSVGQSDDDTLNLIKGIPGCKIKIMESKWNDDMRTGGLVLAHETNKAKDALNTDADWLFYIQADEVLHEDGLEKVREAMLKWKDDKNVEGLIFNYRHFYGSYAYEVESFSHWYAKEIRIIRNSPLIRSYRDAQGFRRYNTREPDDIQLINGGSKLKVKDTGAYIYHYGWVKNPYIQKRKWSNFQKLWHNDDWITKNEDINPEYDYSQEVALMNFTGKHPAVMNVRIKMQDWNFKPVRRKLTLKERALSFTIRHFGWNPGLYRNYKLI